MTVKVLVEDIARAEREQADSRNVGEFVPLMIPAETYVALSDEAKKTGMTVAQLVSKAFKFALTGL